MFYFTFQTLLYVGERKELKFKNEFSPSRYIKKGVETTIKIWFDILAFLHGIFVHLILLRAFLGATEREGVES